MDKRFKYGDLVRVTHTYVGRVSQNEEQSWILINPETHERLGYFDGVDRDGHTYALEPEAFKNEPGGCWYAWCSEPAGHTDGPNWTPHKRKDGKRILGDRPRA